MRLEVCRLELDRPTEVLQRLVGVIELPVHATAVVVELGIRAPIPVAIDRSGPRPPPIALHVAVETPLPAVVVERLRCLDPSSRYRRSSGGRTRPPVSGKARCRHRRASA